MKFERFIATFVMMNIVLMIAVVFCIKNEIFMETSSQLIYGSKADPDFFTLSPDETGGQKADPALFNRYMNSIFSETHIKKDELDAIAELPPYEKSTAIIKMFSLMGDGKCLTGESVSDKINRMADKNGCSKDFAQVFALLADYSGLNARIVSNGQHYANEIYDGEKWIYIDPYFAMSVSGRDGHMSYPEFAKAMVESSWMRFDYFGGEDHCMSGKPIAEHPYFGDRYAFAPLYIYNGTNIPEMVEMEKKVSGRHLAIRKLTPYKEKAPAIVYGEAANSRDSIIKKYVMVGMAVIFALFIGTDIVLPVYYLTGLFRQPSKRQNLSN